MTAAMSGLRTWRRQTWSFNTVHRAEWVARHAASTPAGARVLDVGAGIGQYRSLFAHCDYRTQDFGLEPGTAGKYTPLDYESDITAIPVPDGSFDVVLCTEVLEHVPKPVAAVREMSRILRPGGRLLLSAPLGSHLHQEPYHFYGGYTPYWYRHFLPAVGCDVEAIEPNHGFFSFFGQEALRFSEYVRPRNTRGRPFGQRVALSMIWVATLPLFHALPVLARSLDRLALERTATVGYHVVAMKRAAQGPDA
jgi:SAM-dependent methyltransferase